MESKFKTIMPNGVVILKYRMAGEYYYLRYGAGEPIDGGDYQRFSTKKEAIDAKGRESPMVALAEYIADKHDGSQARFARANGVQRQQVTQWLNKGFTVSGGVLYSPRRKLDLAT